MRPGRGTVSPRPDGTAASSSTTIVIQGSTKANQKTLNTRLFIVPTIIDPARDVGLTCSLAAAEGWTGLGNVVRSS